VCRREHTKNSVLMCDQCARSYTRAMGEDATIAAVILWAARRAWRAARAGART
jgi:hypothetical protein